MGYWINFWTKAFTGVWRILASPYHTYKSIRGSGIDAWATILMMLSAPFLWVYAKIKGD